VGKKGRPEILYIRRGGGSSWIDHCNRKKGTGACVIIVDEGGLGRGRNKISLVGENKEKGLKKGENKGRRQGESDDHLRERKRTKITNSSLRERREEGTPLQSGEKKKKGNL